MSNSFFSGLSWKIRLAFGAMTMGAIAVPLALIAIFVRPEPMAQALLLGCYTAPDAPPLNIEADAVHILEPQQRKLNYAAEPSKTGYQLNVRPALQLTPQRDGRYSFIPTHGIGFFWPLLPAQGSNRDRVRHPAEYAGRLRMIATDGGEVTYTRIATSNCR